jgi:hypothetical protein
MCAGSDHEVLAEFFGLRTIAATGKAGTVHDCKFKRKSFGESFEDFNVFSSILDAR